MRPASWILRRGLHARLDAGAVQQVRERARDDVRRVHRQDPGTRSGAASGERRACSEADVSLPTRDAVLAWARESKRPEILALLQRLRDASPRDAHRALECLFLRFMVRDAEEGREHAK